jgi:hypothetical protein
MACKQGIRQDIEKSKEFYRKQKEYDPYWELWKHLVNKVHAKENGFDVLKKEEKLYFAVCLFDGEVYNGGTHQFFSNSAGEFFNEVVEGLTTLKATNSLSLLKQATQVLFGEVEPPKDRLQRWNAMKQYPDNENEPRPSWDVELDEIDRQYYEDADNLSKLLTTYAEEKGLIQPFIK